MATDNWIEDAMKQEAERLQFILERFLTEGEPREPLNRDVEQMLKLGVVRRHMEEIEFFILKGHNTDALAGLRTVRDIVNAY